MIDNFIEQSNKAIENIIDNHNKIMEDFCRAYLSSKWSDKENEFFGIKNMSKENKIHLMKQMINSIELIHEMPCSENKFTSRYYFKIKGIEIPK